MPKVSLRFLLNRNYATSSAIQREDSQEIVKFTRSTINKIHFPSLYQEPSTKQRGDLSLNISPLL